MDTFTNHVLCWIWYRDFVLNNVIHHHCCFAVKQILNARLACLFVCVFHQWLKMSCRPESSRSSLIWNDSRSWLGKNRRTAARTPNCEFHPLVQIQNRLVKRESGWASNLEPDCLSSPHVLIAEHYTVFLIIVTATCFQAPCGVLKTQTADVRTTSAIYIVVCDYRNTPFPDDGL